MSDQIIVQHPHKLEQTITKYIVQTDKIYRIISIFFNSWRKKTIKINIISKHDIISKIILEQHNLE